jgi:hypothetical protein
MPTATEQELNPRALERANKLKDIAADPYLLAQRYVEAANRQKSDPIITVDDHGEPVGQAKRENSIAVLLESDPYGFFSQMPAVQRIVQDFLPREWMDAAVQGVEVPSAIAQPHGQLDAWEICNRNLPHGAVVAYYRSPLPNASAIAFGINNTSDLKLIDPESFGKRGVVYVNSETAKNIAISDFDGDRFGQFVGYIAKEPDRLISRMRDELKDAAPEERYDLAHQMIEKLIAERTELTEDSYPMSVQELSVATAKENRPQQIQKAPKVPHPWSRAEGQPISSAIFSAWMRVADNPIGMVANSAINLQVLSQHALNVDQNAKISLFKRIGDRYGQLKDIPTNERLEQAGLPALDLKAG